MNEHNVVKPRQNTVPYNDMKYSYWKNSCECKVCGKAFIYKNILQNHKMRVHTVEKPNKCKE